MTQRVANSSTGNDTPHRLTPQSMNELCAIFDGKRDQGLGSDRPLAMAVSFFESGWQTHPKDNVNSDGSRDRGLWQINDKAHPDISDSCAYDSVCSTHAAHDLYVAAGYRFTAWTGTYGNPSKRPQIDALAKKIKDNHSYSPNADDAGPFGVGRGPGADTIVGNTVNSVGDFLGSLSIIFDPAFWLRVGKVLIGATAIILGAVMVGRVFLNSPAGQELAGKAQTAAKFVATKK